MKWSKSDIILWVAGIVCREMLDRGEGVSSVAAHTVTDACEDLNPVALHKASAGG